MVPLTVPPICSVPSLGRPAAAGASAGPPLRPAGPGPSSRIRRAAATSSARGPSPAPGTSKMAGSSWRDGCPRKAASPAAPMVPSPTFSWRSRLAPNSTFESFRCRQCRRSSPMTVSNSLTTASASPTEAKFTPEAHRCWVSRHTPSRWPALARSRTSASSSKLRPTVPPAPAAFSSRIGQSPGAPAPPAAVGLDRLDQGVDHLGEALGEAGARGGCRCAAPAPPPPCPGPPPGWPPGRPGSGPAARGRRWPG